MLLGIGITFIYFIFFLSPPIVGLVLSAVGMKKQKSPINMAGLVLNIIAISLHILKIIIIIQQLSMI